ncbi:MAG TPA: PH domain-containing protein [Vicingaceae bacterium]
MKFTSRKDILFTSLVFGVIMLLVGLTFLQLYQGKEWHWANLLVFAVILLLFWIYFDTSYLLTKEYLIYKSGPIRGKINMADIREVEANKTLYVGIKPALARKGLIIKYNQYDEIYISPNTNESFIKKLLELNGEIKVS